ncbi:MAG: rhodanese-like domain-containing protein [Chromatiales bacterium]|nr:rhodanese-like domain-containing protein [Chromatiales bacterium]
MEVEQLHGEIDRVTVVDVRSRYEYDTLHIKGAAHIRKKDRYIFHFISPPLPFRIRPDLRRSTARAVFDAPAEDFL